MRRRLPDRGRCVNIRAVTGVLLKPLKLDRWWVFTDDINAACGIGPIILDPGTEIAIENRRGPEMTYSEVIAEPTHPAGNA